jgi:ATP-dependent exoDNAse (exonuclease V) alpha subunit
LKDEDPIVMDRRGRLVRRGEIRNVGTLIIDEYSMVPEYIYAEALANCSRIVLVGDRNQLPPVNSNGINTNDYHVIELTEQMRQERTDTGLYRAIEMFKGIIEGKKEPSEPEWDDTLVPAEHTLMEYYLDGDIDVMLAYTNRMVNHLNRSTQMALFSTDAPQVGQTLILRSSMLKSASESKNAIILNNGEPVVMKEVVEEYENGVILAELDIGESRFVIPNWINPYEWSQEMGVYWNTFKHMYIKADLTHAMSIHKAQGQTFNAVGIAKEDVMGCMEPELMNRLMYVALSRAKHKAIIA